MASELKSSKCTFLAEKVTYIGLELSSNSVSSNTDKISAVADWKHPTNVKELRYFRGFCGDYRRFVNRFAQITGLLHKLVNSCLHELKVNKRLSIPFVHRWSQACHAAFEELKERLASAPVLPFPDFTQPFRLETDASNEGIGAVLLQLRDGKYRVIAYASRRLRPTEMNMQNYSSMRLELLTLKWAVAEKVRSFLLYAEFGVFTDNNSLNHLQTAKLGAEMGIQTGTI